MLECVTGRKCFGFFSTVDSLRCQRCPDIFRCAKYESDRAAYYERILKERRGMNHA